MEYSPRDLRAARLFSLLLIGFAIALMIVGAITFATRPTQSADFAATNALAAKSLVKGKPQLPPGVGYGVCGFTLGCLGAALSFKVRQLVRTGGVEPTDLRK